MFRKTYYCVESYFHLLALNTYRIVSNIGSPQKYFQHQKVLLFRMIKIMRWSKGALIGAAPSTCIGTEKNRRAAWTKLTKNWWAFSKNITVQNRQRRCRDLVLIHSFVSQRSQYLFSCQSYSLLPNLQFWHSTRGHATRLIGVRHQ